MGHVTRGGIAAGEIEFVLERGGTLEGSNDIGELVGHVALGIRMGISRTQLAHFHVGLEGGVLECSKGSVLEKSLLSLF